MRHSSLPALYESYCYCCKALEGFDAEVRIGHKFQLIKNYWRHLSLNMTKNSIRMEICITSTEKKITEKGNHKKELPFFGNNRILSENKPG